MTMTDNINAAPPVYCFRAECEADIHALLDALSQFPGELQQVTLTPLLLSDTQCEITVQSLSLNAMRGLCRGVEDGHVMLETIQPKALYTGERTMQIRLKVQSPRMTNLGLRKYQEFAAKPDYSKIYAALNSADTRLMFAAGEATEQMLTTSRAETPNLRDHARAKRIHERIGKIQKQVAALMVEVSK